MDKRSKENKVYYQWSEEEIVLLAFEGTEESVSEYVAGEYPENPALTWTELKEKVIVKYASARTSVETSRKLSRLKQEEGETLIELGERAVGLALQAYPN